MRFILRLGVTAVTLPLLAMAGTSKPPSPPSASRITTVVPATMSCWGCYPGGSGNPVICTSADHFDKPNLSGNFSGTPHGDQECIASECTADHDACSPDGLPAAVEDAIETADAEGLKLLWRKYGSVHIDERTHAVTLLRCDTGELVKQFDAGADLIKEMMTR